MIGTMLDRIEKEGHAHILNVLDAKALGSINRFIDGHKEDFSPALIGKGENRQRQIQIRGDYTHWIDPLSPPTEFTPLIILLEEIKREVNRRLFLGLKELECHLALYPAGTFYKKHLDRHESESSRALSFVFYLHEEWRPEDGGELTIYDTKGAMIEEVKPLPGSLVCFLSSEFPHEVKTSYKERRSLTGWMHTKIIN
jgi:SM-20-related protein